MHLLPHLRKLIDGKTVREGDATGGSEQEHGVVHVPWRKNSFIWFGPIPRVTLTDPELIKEVLNKIYDFGKLKLNLHVKLLVPGLARQEREKWSKHRKNMLPLFIKCCDDLISKWEGMLSSDGSSEIKVWPFLQNLASDAISRTTFGSSYEEGRRTFQLLKEQTELTMKIIFKVYIPGWK